MATYLVRCIEIGRDTQSTRGKLRRDLDAQIHERLPGASVETSPGRLFVEVDDDHAAAAIAALPGVTSVSPCTRVDTYEALEREVVARATGASSISVRVRRRDGGLPRGVGISAGLSTLELAGKLASATHVPVDLDHPDVEIGVELRGEQAYVFDAIIDGVDRAGPLTPRAPGQARFVADQMLGKLATRLRLLGYDTLTVHDIADSEVTRLAAADGRILLTRDGPLAQTKAVPVHFVAARDPREQLVEVLRTFGLTPDPDHLFSRCTLCNTEVEPVAEADVADELPPGVRDRGLGFLRCPSCDQLYWRGSHVERILAELRAAGL